MKTLTALLTVALMATQAQAGKKYETSLGVAIDTAAFNDITVTMAGHASWVGDTVSIYRGYSVASFASDSIWGQPHHDTTKEYVSGIDTVIKLDRVECDTVGLKIVMYTDDQYDTAFKNIVSSDTFYQAHWDKITCDTVYSVTFVDIWSPKRAVYLTPHEWQALQELINPLVLMLQKEKQ